jgi:hypothetical protein
MNNNQNNIIAFAVAFVVLLIVGGIAYAERPIPITPQAPAEVVTTDPVAPTNTQPVMANALPGGGSAAGGMGGGGNSGGAKAMSPGGAGKGF